MILTKRNISICMLGHKRIPSREGGIELVVEELGAHRVLVFPLSTAKDSGNRSCSVDYKV